MAKKKKTVQIINPLDKQREHIKKANKAMQEAWDLIYQNHIATRNQELDITPQPGAHIP